MVLDMTNDFQKLPILPFKPEAFADNDGLIFVLNIEEIDYRPKPRCGGPREQDCLHITFTMRAEEMTWYDPEKDDIRSRAMFNNVVRSKRETVSAFMTMLDMAWAMMASEREERRAG